MWNRICVMLPTYGRSGSMLPQFIGSCLSTAAKQENITFAFCVNKNDKDTIDYLNKMVWRADHKPIIVMEDLPKPHLAKYFNMLYEATKPLGDDCLVTMFGDDMQFITKGWDREILNLVNTYNGIGVFWCNDNFIARERLCVNMFVTRKMVEATESLFMDETYPAEMIDLIWWWIGKHTKSLHFLPNCVIKHNHSTAKPKDQWDKTFNRLRPQQQVAHKMGKQMVLDNARKIADILIKKGFIGDNKD